MTIKKISDSKVIQTRLILPGDTNAHNSLFGGELMKMIDNTASICFLKHTRTSGVTASMDNLNFIKPLPINNSVTIEATVSGTGNRSAEIFCKVVGEDLASGERYLAATAFLTFVIVTDIDNDTIPGIEAETEEEQFIIDGYEKRRHARQANFETDKAFQAKISID